MIPITVSDPSENVDVDEIRSKNDNQTIILSFRPLCSLSIIWKVQRLLSASQLSRKRCTEQTNVQLYTYFQKGIIKYSHYN